MGAAATVEETPTAIASSRIDREKYMLTSYFFGKAGNIISFLSLHA
jgi:hypothetical protein